jgi:endonuclease I
LDQHRDAENNNTVRLIYRQVDVPATVYGTATTWNREHLWPKSHGVGTSAAAAAFTDVHHLRPADWNVNSARNNLYFGSCGLVLPLNECQIPANLEATSDTAKDGQIFLPPAAVRGDVARALFYMDLRYYGASGDVDLELTDCPTEQDSSKMAYLSQLLEWSAADLVDDAERVRNDRVCERWKGNRNPFVDFPDLVSLIYGQAQTTPISEDGSGGGGNGYPSCNNIVVADPAPVGGYDETISGNNQCGQIVAPGDVLIVAINSDEPDMIVLVALEALPAGLDLYITDNAWTGSASAFRTNEGTLKVSVSYTQRRTQQAYT